MSTETKWEVLYTKENGNGIEGLFRMEVPGGWIYRTCVSITLDSSHTDTLVYVPHPVVNEEKGLGEHYCPFCDRMVATRFKPKWAKEVRP